MVARALVAKLANLLDAAATPLLVRFDASEYEYMFVFRRMLRLYRRAIARRV